MSMRFLHLKNETNCSCPDLKGENYRASFHTRSSAKGPRKKIYRAHLEGEGPRKGEKAVVKVFRDAPGTEAMCDAEIAKHAMAQRLCKKFNKKVSEASDKITFTSPFKSTVDKIGMGTYLLHHSRKVDKEEWVLIEENLKELGDYQLLLRKTGDRASKDPTSLDAFMHFTYMESGQQRILCGFQGVHTDEFGYKLTTPCIHSIDKSYGQTDKGLAGIQQVFSKHRCNNLCWNWPKPEEGVEKENSGATTDEGSGSDSDGNDNELTVAVASKTMPDTTLLTVSGNRDDCGSGSSNSSGYGSTVST